MSLLKITTNVVQKTSRAMSSLLNASQSQLQQAGLKASSNHSDLMLSSSSKKTSIPSHTNILKANASSAAMPEEPEGFSTLCRPCTFHDREEMIDFMSRLFVTREPLMRSIGATPENSRKFVAFCIDEALDQKASFLAINEETGKICGLRVNAIGPSSGNEMKIDFGPQINAVPKFLHYMENGMSEILKTERYMRHVAICVEQSVAQCGIATDLMRLSVKHAQKENLYGLTAMCSWRLPYKLASKIGFKVVREVPYDEYARNQLMLSKEHVQSFHNLAATEGSARMMVKKLQ